MLSVCDLILGFGNYLGDGNEDNTLCHLQGFIIEFGSISGGFWTAVIAYSIREVVLLQPRNLNIEDKMKKFDIVVWSSSFILSIVPFFSNSYGDADGWCWISKYGDHSVFWGTFWRMVCFYVPAELLLALRGHESLLLSHFDVFVSTAKKPLDPQPPVRLKAERDLGCGASSCAQ